MERKRKLESFTDEEFTKICLNNTCLKNIYVDLGYSQFSSKTKNLILNRAKSIGIIDQLKERLKPKPKSKSAIKKRFIDSLGKEEIKCSECKIGEWWNGKRLVLQLDHKNGINNDHHFDNLRLLCPNCHSQTHTYSRPHKVRKNKDIIIPRGNSAIENMLGDIEVLDIINIDM